MGYSYSYVCVYSYEYNTLLNDSGGLEIRDNDRGRGRLISGVRNAFVEAQLRAPNLRENCVGSPTWR